MRYFNGWRIALASDSRIGGVFYSTQSPSSVSLAAPPMNGVKATRSLDSVTRPEAWHGTGPHTSSSDEERIQMPTFWAGLILLLIDKMLTLAIQRFSESRKRRGK
jgi:hypothetical protein